MIASQLWSISLLKTSCCVSTKDTRSLVWMGVVLQYLLRTDSSFLRLER